ncbi:hypothetical protein [Gimibacter soli]|uniref:Lipoprotein n=1 Tax=Gimibacter soli TaxID=3024400 RepID=A0AAF0BM12_9PROT|nr:hypothetical protein [Gimibacter soli]WCL53866.1 hypothetical protein PH603_15110 [Gimibacter soli]
MTAASCKVIFVIVAACALAACATPDAIRDQANASAASLTKVSNGLNQYAAATAIADERRLERALEMHRTVDDVLERRVNRQVGSARKLFASVKGKAEESTKRWDATLARQVALESEQRANLRKLVVPTHELAATQKALAELGVKSSFKTRAKQFLVFVKQTGKDYKALREAAEKAGAEADDKADDEARKLTADASQ